jgi:hypothetical protein
MNRRQNHLQNATESHKVWDKYGNYIYKVKENMKVQKLTNNATKNPGGMHYSFNCLWINVKSVCHKYFYLWCKI